MQVAGHIHAIRIPFKIPISPDKEIDRDVYSYIVFGEKVTLVDCGVKGSEAMILDYMEKGLTGAFHIFAGFTRQF
jgi:hypothetical protein